MASTIPGPARDFVRIVTQAVDAAITGGNAATYDRATARLATQPTGGRVLGDVLRSLLEDTHPDGLDSEDITLVIGRCYRAAAAWLAPERINVTVLLAHDTVPVEPPTWPDYAWHAPLLVADLLPFTPATLGSYLETTFAEYAREAREELP
jgi:hypothetical protein